MIQVRKVEKNEHIFVKKLLRHVRTQGIVEQAKTNDELRPTRESELTTGLTKDEALINDN